VGVARHWRVMHLFYNMLIILALPVLLVYFGYRWLRGKSREGWAERMGYLPVFSGEHPIWVHAVSAGEAVAAEAVVRALRERLPDVPILYTAGTPEGRATARKRMGSLLTHVAYAPYDLPWAVARAMDRVRPRLYLLVESDLWPNLLQAAAVRGVPAMLANGYISERTLRRGRLVPALYRWIFGNLCSICVQTEAVRRRALALHAVPERVCVVGNVKYDQATAPLTNEEATRWRALFRLRPDEPVLVAGSTHPGEEEKVLAAYTEMRASGIAPRLILAPRHPQRAEEVEALVHHAGFACVRRSHLGEGSGAAPDPEAVILLDTMGELAGVFSLATVVFLGGSLVPVGGHDILQPLIAGKPVLLGPYTHRQREIVEDALDAGVVWVVATPQELARRSLELMKDAGSGDGYATNAVSFVSGRRGASQRCAEEAARLSGEMQPLRTHGVGKAVGKS
jgi:3-deoxy-D-manno-octulosonic-acid transferase